MKIIFIYPEKNMEDKKLVIEKTLREWKVNFEQVDGICTIGLRL